MAIYIDSSAFVKLLVDETGSRALRTFLGDRRGRRVSSALLRAEALRAAVTRGAGVTAHARAALRSVDLIAVSDAVLELAGTLEPPALRTLDAIHLSTALSIGTDLEVIVTYDRRMLEGAVLLGLAAVAPGGSSV